MERYELIYELTKHRDLRMHILMHFLDEHNFSFTKYYNSGETFSTKGSFFKMAQSYYTQTLQARSEEHV